MTRKRAIVLAGLAAVGVVLFFLVGAIIPSDRGPGPEDPPYSAEGIAACLRSLEGNLPVDRENGTELRDDSRMVIGPDKLSPEQLHPVPIEYVKVEWIFDVQTLDTLKLQLYIAANDVDAERTFQAMLENHLSGGLTREEAAERLYRRGNVVFVWDEGGSEEEREQAHSCLVS